MRYLARRTISPANGVPSMSCKASDGTTRDGFDRGIEPRLLSRNFRHIRIFRDRDGAMTQFAPIAKTNVHPKAEFTASDLKRGGSVLEAASDGKVVRITRRDTRFLLICEDHVMTLVAELTDTAPKSLEQMLEGFTAEDAASLRGRMTARRSDEPVGKELL